jgi:uncharacterized protein
MTDIGPDSCEIFDCSPYLKLFIDKEGNWFQNGAEIIHREIYLQFNQMLEKDAGGEYFVKLGREICKVEVEDAPFVVKGLQTKPGELWIELNDGTTEKFDPALFWMNEDNVPYTSVKESKFHARFLRPAYYQMASYIVSDNDADFFIKIGAKSYPIERGTRRTDS